MAFYFGLESFHCHSSGTARILSSESACCSHFQHMRSSTGFCCIGLENLQGHLKKLHWPQRNTSSSRSGSVGSSVCIRSWIKSVKRQVKKNSVLTQSLLLTFHSVSKSGNSNPVRGILKLSRVICPRLWPRTGDHESLRPWCRRLSGNEYARPFRNTPFHLVSNLPALGSISSHTTSGALS